MRLPKKMVEVIMECISSPTMQVLWNENLQLLSNQVVAHVKEIPYLLMWLLCAWRDSIKSLKRLYLIINGNQSKFIGMALSSPMYSLLMTLLYLQKHLSNKLMLFNKAFNVFVMLPVKRSAVANQEFFFSKNAPPDLQQEVCNTLHITRSMIWASTLACLPSIIMSPRPLLPTCVRR